MLFKVIVNQEDGLITRKEMDFLTEKEAKQLFKLTIRKWKPIRVSIFKQAPDGRMLELHKEWHNKHWKPKDYILDL